MQPPIKNQTDIGVDEPTLDASNSNTNRDMTDQSGAQEADINYMLSRFGVTQPRGAPTYGVTDYNMDLQAAITSVREAEDAYRKLDPELRRKFDNMGDFLSAVNNGSLEIKNEPAPEPPQTEAQILKQRLDALEKQQKTPPDGATTA